MSDKPTRSVLCLFPDRENDKLEEFRRKHIKNPGKSIPFHITLFHKFYLPEQLDDKIIEKLRSVASNTKSFEFDARPISYFPTTRVLYLNPSPVSFIEKINKKLFHEFPDFYESEYGYPVYHMTIAFNNAVEEVNKIIHEYIHVFGKDPLKLKAGKIGIYSQFDKEWKEIMSFDFEKGEVL